MLLLACSQLNNRLVGTIDHAYACPHFLIDRVKFGEKKSIDFLGTGVFDWMFANIVVEFAQLVDRVVAD